MIAKTEIDGSSEERVKAKHAVKRAGNGMAVLMHLALGSTTAAAVWLGIVVFATAPDGVERKKRLLATVNAVAAQYVNAGGVIPEDADVATVMATLRDFCQAEGPALAAIDGALFEVAGTGGAVSQGIFWDGRTSRFLVLPDDAVGFAPASSSGVNLAAHF